MNGMNGSSVAGDAAPSINGAEEGSVDEEIPLEFEEDAVEWHDAVASHDLHEDEPSVDPQLFGHLAPVPCAPLDADADLPPHPLPAAERGAAVSAMRAAVLASDGAEKVALWEDRSPATLERFLRARDFDVPVAAALFLDHRKWREGFGWSVPSSSVPSKEFDQQKVALQAVSKDGKHPLLVLLARNHVTAGRVVAEVRSYVVYTLDKLCDFLPPGGQFVVLVDFVGMTSKNADVKVLLACFEILQKRYVERVKHLWFCNPPTIFWALWSVVKPFVAPKTREKIVFVFGKDVATTALKLFNPADLPRDHGGTGALRPVSPGPCLWEQEGAPRKHRY